MCLLHLLVQANHGLVLLRLETVSHALGHVVGALSETPRNLDLVVDLVAEPLKPGAQFLLKPLQSRGLCFLLPPVCTAVDLSQHRSLLSDLERAQLLQSLLLLLPLLDVFDVLFVVLSGLGLEVAVVFLRLFQLVLNLAVGLLSFLHALHRDLFSGRCAFLVLLALFFHKTLPQILVTLQLFKSSLPIDELPVHPGTLVGSLVEAWPARGQPGRALV